MAGSNGTLDPVWDDMDRYVHDRVAIALKRRLSHEIPANGSGRNLGQLLMASLLCDRIALSLLMTIPRLDGI